jgi:hypothetical protein
MTFRRRERSALWLADENLEWEQTAGGGAFEPRDTGKVAGWLRLQASSQSGGEFTNWVDAVNSNPAVQADTDRRAAVSASVNGLPTMVFDATDMYQWPLSAAINNMTTKLGFWFWFKPSNVAAVQRLLNCTITTGAAATFEKFSLYANNRTLLCETYITNATGRVGTTASNVLTVDTYTAIYMQYDSSRGGDANLAIFTDGTSRTLNYTNIGAGGTLGALQAPTGNIIIGSFNNSDTPAQPILDEGELGPNLFAFNDNLTAGEIADFLAFEAPT